MLTTERRGKSEFWQRWLKAKPYTGPKLKELEVNLIVFDEYASITPEAIENLKKFIDKINDKDK